MSDEGERFEVAEPIGRGGMATIWRARDLMLDRWVAVKRLHPHLADESEAGLRFQQEARAAAALGHPAIVTVYDVGEDQEGPFIVMEYVEGESLAARIAREGALDPIVAVSIGLQVAEAVHHAHLQGVIHRDIKPSNILIDQEGRVRVTDFGIARTLDEAEGLTAEGSIMGTASYLAPELALGEPAGPASDVYSLGVVLYEALSGRPPFEGTTEAARLLAHQRQQPPPLGAVPRTLEWIVMGALRKDPAERPSSAGDLGAALRDWLESVDSTRPIAIESDSADSGTRPLPMAERPGGPALLGSGWVVGERWGHLRRRMSGRAGSLVEKWHELSGRWRKQLEGRSAWAPVVILGALLVTLSVWVCTPSDSISTPTTTSPSQAPAETEVPGERNGPPENGSAEDNGPPEDKGPPPGRGGRP